MASSTAHSGMILGVLLAAFVCTHSRPLRAEPCPQPTPAPGQTLAHPVVAGSAGPFRHVTLTLLRPASAPAAPFTGLLNVNGTTCLKLNGPDEPANFFLIDVKAVLFTRLGQSEGNGIVVLYDSSQIGPGNGTEHEALVYRIDAGAATRQLGLENRLAGVSTAAQARARLAAKVVK